jgi:hypothetical protein
VIKSVLGFISVSKVQTGNDKPVLSKLEHHFFESTKLNDKDYNYTFPVRDQIEFHDQKRTISRLGTNGEDHYH